MRAEMKMPAVRWLVRASIVGVVAASLSGCANQSRLAAWEKDGWRQGRVQGIVEGKDLTNVHELECVSGFSPDRIATSRFAVVSYAASIGARRHLLRTVVVPDSLDLKAGDVVQLNVHDCEKPITRWDG